MEHRAEQVAGEPQRVRWVARLRGLEIEYDRRKSVVLWDVLKTEIETELLPQVRVIPLGSTVELGDLGEHRDWVMRVVSPDGRELANVWLGTNGDNGWMWDGLVRIGDPNKPEGEKVWQTFQRYSDGTYRRISARVVTVEDLVKK